MATKSNFAGARPTRPTYTKRKKKVKATDLRLGGTRRLKEKYRNICTFLLFWMKKKTFSDKNK